MADRTEAVRIIRVRGVPEGIENLTAKLEKLKQAQDGVAASGNAVGVASETSAKKQLSAQRAFEALEARTDSASRAYQQFSRELNTVSRAFDTGVFGKGTAGVTRFSAEIDAAKQRLQSLGAALAKGSPGLDGAFGIGRTAPSASGSAAAFEAEFARIEQVAQQRAAQIGAEFGRELSARLTGASGKSARDAASVFEAELGRLDSIAKLKAEQTGAEFSRALNASLIKGPGKSASESASVFMEQERTLKGLRVEFDQLAIAQERRAASEAQINGLARQGLITETQRGTMLDAVNRRYEDTAAALARTQVPLGKYVTGVGLARHELVNLSRQAQDVFVSLASGQSPLTVLIQQGTQIADVFAASRGSVGGFLTQVASGLGRFALSTGGLATGVAVVGAGAAVAAYQYAESQEAVERALLGVGRGAGISATQINRLAEATAEAGKISRSAARDIISGAAATGRIDPSLLPALPEAGRNFGILTGEGTTKGAAALTSALANPTAGATELDKRLGFLNDELLQFIKNSEASGNRSAAQKALFDAFNPTLADAEKTVGGLARAWEAVSKAVSSAADSIGRALVDEISLENRLAQAVERRNEMRRGRMFELSTPKIRDDADIRVQQLQDAILRRDQRERYNNNTRQAEVSSNRLSSQGGDLLRTIFGDETRLQNLRNQRDLLDKVFGDSSAMSKLGPLAEKVQPALERLNTGISNFETSAQRAAKDTELQIAQIDAYTLAQRIAVDMERARTEAIRSGLSETEASVKAEQARSVALAQANREARDAVRSSQDSLRLAGLRPFERRLAENQIAARDNVVRFGGATGGAGAAASGLNSTFSESLQKFMKAVPGLTITSGFRSYQEQADLYARKPHLAAPPGRSQHEKGLAADLAYNGSGSLPPWVRDKAAEFGLTFPLANRARNPEPWHVEPIGGRAQGANGAPAADVVRRNADAAASLEQYNSVIRASNDNLKEQEQELARVAESYGKTTGELTRAQKQQELYNQFARDGAPVTAEIAKQIDSLAAAYGRVADGMARVKLNNDLRFERDQIGRTTDDQAIASRLRSSGLPVDLQSAEASTIRMNMQLTETKDILSGAAKSFVSDIQSGKSAAEALSGVVDKLASKFIDKGIDTLISGLFSTATTGTGGAGFGLIGKLFGFSEGGFTGTGPKAAPAGVVHRGEIVWSQRDISKAGGVAVVEAMRRGMRGYAEGGYVHTAQPYVHSAANLNQASAPTFNISTSVDARGSQLTESQMRAIVAQGNAQLKAELPGYLVKQNQRGGQ